MKKNPFVSIGKRHLNRMTEAQIIKEAKRRGYSFYMVRSGVRVGGGKAFPDKWLETANNRLWKLQAGK